MLRCGEPMPLQPQFPQMLVFVLSICMLFCVSASEREEMKTQQAQTKIEWDSELFKVGLFWDTTDAILGIFVTFGEFESDGENKAHVCTNPNGASKDLGDCNTGMLRNEFVVEGHAEQRQMAGGKWWTSYVKRKELRPGLYMVWAYFVATCGAGAPLTTTPTPTTSTTTKQESMFSLGRVARMFSFGSDAHEIDEHDIVCYGMPCHIKSPIQEQKFRAMVKLGNLTKGGKSSVSCSEDGGLQQLFTVVIGEDGSIVTLQSFLDHN